MAADVVLTRRRFTVEDYHRMAEAGILWPQNPLVVLPDSEPRRRAGPRPGAHFIRTDSISRSTASRCLS